MLSQRHSTLAILAACSLHHLGAVVLDPAGCIQNALGGVQPTPHYEDVETKRRFANLLAVSGLLDNLALLKARPATLAEIGLVHTSEYIAHIQKLSADTSKGSHAVGHEVSMAPGGHEIAALAAGASIALTDAALDGTITNGYTLTRWARAWALRASRRCVCMRTDTQNKPQAHQRKHALNTNNTHPTS